MSNKQELLDDLGKALGHLADASERLRLRLDQIDPYEQPARWSAINDQIRGLDERISRLRDDQQRVSLARLELRAISPGDVDALRRAIATLSELVRTAATAVVVVDAAGKLMAVAGDIVKKTLPQG